MEIFNDFEVSFSKDLLNFSFFDIDNININDIIDEKFESIINSDPNDCNKIYIEEFDPEVTLDAIEGEAETIGFEIEEILKNDNLFEFGIIERIGKDEAPKLNIKEEREEEESCVEIQENLSEFLQFNKKSQKVKPYSCSACNFSTDNRYYIQHHFRTAKHQKNILSAVKSEEILIEVLDELDVIEVFSCGNCGTLFSNKSQLRDHNRDIHYLKCHNCNRRFKTEKELNLHMARHSQSNYFQCSQCPKNFTTSSNLLRHERIHSETKSFICHVCAKNFGQKTNLLRHLKVHEKKLRANL
jgi:KRAB domain-containing zinc finger protein